MAVIWWQNICVQIPWGHQQHHPRDGTLSTEIGSQSAQNYCGEVAEGRMVVGEIEHATKSLILILIVVLGERSTVTGREDSMSTVDLRN